MSGPLAITAQDVENAALAIADHIVRTPSAVSQTLSDITGAHVIVKFENLQFTASYKERGALNCLLTLSPAERAVGVIAMSAGNHAQGLAHHGARLGIPVTVVMPVGTPTVKVTRCEQLGAEVVLAGDGLGEAAVRAHELADERGLLFVSPFDDARIIAGQGTVALEMLEDHPDLDAVVVPVGGGGLIAGMATFLAARAPHVETIGAESERFPSMAIALGTWDGPVGGSTIAEGIAVATAGSLTQPLVAAHARGGVVVVPEGLIERSVGMLLEVEKTVVEGAGAAGLAAILHQPERFAGLTVGVVLTGGNIEPRLLASVILRSLVRAGRLVHLRVAVDDRPGSLAGLTAAVAAAAGNIVDVTHQRLALEVPIKLTEIDLTIETVDEAHAQRVIGALETAGYTVRRG